MLVPVKSFVLFNFKSMVSITFINPFLLCKCTDLHCISACPHVRSLLEKTIQERGELSMVVQVVINPSAGTLAVGSV